MASLAVYDHCSVGALLIAKGRTRRHQKITTLIQEDCVTRDWV